MGFLLLLGIARWVYFRSRTKFSSGGLLFVCSLTKEFKMTLAVPEWAGCGGLQWAKKRVQGAKGRSELICNCLR